MYIKNRYQMDFLKHKEAYFSLFFGIPFFCNFGPKYPKNSHKWNEISNWWLFRLLHWTQFMYLGAFYEFNAASNMKNKKIYLWHCVDTRFFVQMWFLVWRVYFTNSTSFKVIFTELIHLLFLLKHFYGFN